MDRPIKEKKPLESLREDSVGPSDEATERRHSSSASTSTATSGDSNDSAGQRSRRSRPSVVSASSQLATVKEQRTMSLDKSPKLFPLTSDETVVSSKKVSAPFRQVVAANLLTFLEP